MTAFTLRWINATDEEFQDVIDEGDRHQDGFPSVPDTPSLVSHSRIAGGVLLTLTLLVLVCEMAMVVFWFADFQVVNQRITTILVEVRQGYVYEL